MSDTPEHDTSEHGTSERVTSEQVTSEQDAESVVGDDTVTIHRAPRYFRFMIAGGVVGVVVALILTFSFPEPAGFDFSQVFGFLALFCIVVGFALGAVVALLVDRASRRAAKTILVERVEGGEHPEDGEAAEQLAATAQSVVTAAPATELPAATARPAASALPVMGESGTQPAAEETTAIDASSEPRSSGDRNQTK